MWRGNKRDTWTTHLPKRRRKHKNSPIALVEVKNDTGDQ
jgi:hypothetical protein